MQRGFAEWWPAEPINGVRRYAGLPDSGVRQHHGLVAAIVGVSLIVLVAVTLGPGTAVAAAWLSGVAQVPLEGPLKFVVATVIGLLVTAVHRPRLQDVAIARSMAHAQVLLCVSGALMMVLISDSLARAFGVAGAAGLIRFRTPVEDPKDAAVLFLLMALGMAVGLGAYPMAVCGTLMLCALLWVLEQTATEPGRTYLVELVATSDVFPVSHVQQVFARHQIVVEPREVSGGDAARVKYLAVCQHDLSLETLNADLMAAGTSGVRSVAWEPARKKTL